MSEYQFDLVTIGGGSGGVAASRRAGSYGAKVALCESGLVGGTCVLRGCVPKKLLVYGAHFAEELADAAGFGWSIPEATHDWSRLIAAKDQELTRLNQVYRRMLENSGVAVHYGRAQLVDAHTVQVGDTQLTARHILIATGGAPTLLDIPGRELAITSNEALSLPKLPQRVVIIGGGYIAVEFAGIFHALGSQVTLMARSSLLLRGFDEEVRQHLTQTLQSKGLQLRLGTAPTAITRDDSGQLWVHFPTDGGSDKVATDVVLMATGRAPNTANLGLQSAGVQLGPSGEIKVDAQSATTVPHIFAVGDCTNRMNLTPVAIAEGRAVVDMLFNKQSRRIDYSLVPTAVFSQPPVSTVGLSESAARDLYAALDIYATTFRPMKNTLSGRQERTFMKLVVERQSQRVLGCHMIGPDAPEIIQGLAVALTCGATKQQLDATIGIHPTAAEEFVTMRERRPEPKPDVAQR
jgi:glutathione reductase (NADPH)